MILSACAAAARMAHGVQPTPLVSMTLSQFIEITGSIRSGAETKDSHRCPAIASARSVRSVHLCSTPVLPRGVDDSTYTAFKHIHTLPIRERNVDAFPP